jgi:regulator of sirC expression with transglutaminase-like and TPR domain
MVVNGMWSQEEKDSLVRLLDDPSPSVQQSILAFFHSDEEQAVQFLQSLISNRRGVLAYHAKQYLDRMGIDNTIETFRNFIRSFSYELETGCWLMERTVFPRFDPVRSCEVLDEMGVRALDLFVEPCSIKEKCRVINRVIFHEFGFHGDLESYKSPESSLIGQVLETRKGIPLSLGIIYILVAMRCGVDLRPIGVPGRFMVGCYSEEKPFFIDVFEGGKFLSVADVLIFLETNRITYDEGSLAPIPVGEVISRACRNLQNQFLVSGEQERASLFATFIEAFEDAYKRAHRA